jgi:hypothetical protein
MSQLDATQLAKLQSLTRQVAESPWVPFDADVAWQLAQLAVSTGFSVSDGAFMEQIQLNPLKTLLNWSLQVASLNSAIPTKTPEEAYLADLPAGGYDLAEGAALDNAKADEVYYGTEGRGFNISETVEEYLIRFDVDFSVVQLAAAGVLFTSDPVAVTFHMTNGSDNSSTTVYTTENPAGNYFAGEVVGLPGWYIISIHVPIAAKPSLTKIYIGPNI